MNLLGTVSCSKNKQVKNHGDTLRVDYVIGGGGVLIIKIEESTVGCPPSEMQQICFKRKQYVGY